MTWPADELPRPGCVWTHVLLLDAEALGTASALSLLDSFRRPSLAAGLAGYGELLTIENSGPQAEHQRDPTLMKYALWAMFEPPLRRVEVQRSRMDATDRHVLLLDLWGVQPQRYRRALRFTDAPYYGRRHSQGGGADLVISNSASSPDDRPRVIRSTPEVDFPLWVQALHDELLSPGELSQFLSEYAADTRETRDAIRSLVLSWIARREQRLPGQFRTLVEEFPEWADGELLKRRYLARPAKASGVELAGWLSAVLQALPLLPQGDDLGVSLATSQVLRETPDELGPLLRLVGSKPSPAGKVFVEALTSDLRSGRADHWIREAPDGVAELIRISPQLAALENVAGQVPFDVSWRAARKLRGRKQRGAFMRALLLSGQAVDPAVVFESWTDPVEWTTDVLFDEAVPVATFNPWLRAFPTDDLATVAAVATERRPQLVNEIVLARSDDLKTWRHRQLQETLPHVGPAGAALIGLAALAKGSSSKQLALAIDGYRATSSIESPHARDLAQALNQVLRGHPDGFPAVLTDLPIRNFYELVNADEDAGLARELITYVSNRNFAIDEDHERSLRNVVVAKADRDGFAALFESTFSSLVGSFRKLL